MPDGRITDRTPVYRQIQQHLETLIGDPARLPGDRIPSERTLAEQLGANRMTVRKAIDGLVAAGRLERDGTSGTRITRPRVVARPVDGHTAQGIARLIRSGGGTPGNKLLHFAQGQASAEVAARLGLAEGAELVLFRRLWTVDQVPFCIETTHLAADLVPGLAAEDLIAGQSLYGLLRERYGVETASGERLIGVAACSDLEARLLRLEPGAAGLLLRLVAFDAAGRPIEYTQSMNHPQLVVFKTAKAELE